MLKAFNGEGMTPIIVDSGDQIVESIVKPEVFLVIVDLEFNEKRGLAFHTQLKTASKAFWIALAKKLTTNQRSSLYAAGFADVLTHPVHPVLFKSRARMLLARYLKTNDFPENVELPPGMTRRSNAVTAKPGENSKSSGDKPQSPFQRGESGGGQGPEWNHHSGKKNPNSDDSMQMIKGESNSGKTDYTHSSSGGESDGPEWRNKISPNQKGKDDETKFFQKDAPQGEWNNRTGGPQEESDPDKAKYFKKDDPQGNWNNSVSNNQKPNDQGETKFFQKDAPQGEWNNKLSQNIVAEKKPDTVIQSESSSNSSSQKRAESLNSGSSTTRMRSEMKIDLSPGSLDLTRNQNIPPQRPSQTLGSLRDKILELRENVEWDQKLWPINRLPKGTVLDICSRGLRKCVVELEVLFKEAAQLIKAERITLVSLKPEALPKSAYCPDDLYALCSSDGQIKSNEEVPSVFFPQIEITFERRKAVLLNEPISDPIDGKPRPQNWKINGQIEASSAVFPIFFEARPYAVLFIQFSDKADEKRINMIEQAASFLGLPEVHYSQVDFLSRVYRNKAQ